MEALANMEIPAVGDLAAMARSLPVTYGDVFNLCHMIVSVLSVRKDAGKQFGISNPVAAWASSIITVFAGSLVANPLLGKRRFFVVSRSYLDVEAKIRPRHHFIAVPFKWRYKCNNKTL